MKTGCVGPLPPLHRSYQIPEG